MVWRSSDTRRCSRPTRFGHRPAETAASRSGTRGANGACRASTLCRCEYPLDFVQLTYNILDREPEERLLPLARDRGIAVMVNRPFRQKALIRRFEGMALPGWADEIGASSWAQFMLKFILAHPAVTVAIPATTRIDHVRENMAAAADPLPDEAMRRRMVAHIREF